MYNAQERLDSSPVKPAMLNLSNEHFSGSKFIETFQKFNPLLPASIPYTFCAWEPLVLAEDTCDSDANPECDPNLGLSVKIMFEDKNEKMLLFNGYKHFENLKK